MEAKIIQVAGHEHDIVAISRVCTGKDDTPLTPEQVRASIFNLIKRRHWSPFEFAHIWCTIEAPIYVMRQWMRHQGAWMEKSRRYTNDAPTIETYDEAQGILDQTASAYTDLLELKEKPENARKILPVATYTKCWYNPNVRDFLHFLRLRLDPHAQSEIRELATSLYAQFKKGFPNICDAFEEYELGEQSTSLEDLATLLDILEDVDKDILKEFRKDAKRRFSMVKGVLEGMSLEMGDSTEDGEGTEVSSTDGSEVLKEV